MDHTLAPIILPMLKQLKATKHGSGFIDMEDVPEYMRTTETEDYEDQQCFDFYHEDKEERKYNIHHRYEWALDEMIFAFEHLVDDSWEDKYSNGEMDHYSEPCKWDEDGKPTLYTFKEGPNHTYTCDYDGLKKEWDRVDNGLRLFGKYFRTLWD
jgi:YD repeat-containing protein